MSAPSKGTILLRVLTEHAENNWVCPSIPRLAELSGLCSATVSDYLRKLRQAGEITSRLVRMHPHGQARIVTITSTGKSTRKPEPTTRYNAHPKPAFTPTLQGSPVRWLEGEEFRARAAELMARDAEERRKREMVA